MTPTPGTLWRSHATGSLYRVAEVDLSRPCECVRLELIEPGKALLDDWAGQVESNRTLPQPQGRDITIPEPRTMEAMREFAVGMAHWRELQWFERAATFVRSAA